MKKVVNIKSEKKNKIDIAVLMIFFSRDKQFGQVFEQVALARPSILYLYQDGARVGRDDDVIGIEKCRKIADSIDWECEVHYWYQEKNMGCDPSEYLSQKWMFSEQEMGIVLEDDDVPSQSFFPFCKELLERYKDDYRINIICGMNNYDVAKHTQDSYLFTKKGSIWGWASWRRVIDTWDGEYSWINDEYKRTIIADNMGQTEFDIWIPRAEAHAKTGKAHYESINAAAMFLHNRMNIVPKYNMICNIGIAAESTHSVNDIRVLPRGIQRLMYKETYDIEFPLKHPDRIEIDPIYEKLDKISSLKKVCYTIESFIRSIVYLGVGSTLKRIKRKLNKLQKKGIEMGKRQYFGGAMISYIAIIFNVVLGILYTPWMVGKIGQSSYALYTIANSVISIFMIDFGLSAAVSRFVAKYRAENDDSKSNKLLGSVTLLYILIDVLIFIILMVIYLNIHTIYEGAKF